MGLVLIIHINEAGIIDTTLYRSMYEQIPAVESSNVGSLACFAESQSQLSHLLRGRGDGFGIGKV